MMLLKRVRFASHCQCTPQSLLLLHHRFIATQASPLQRYNVLVKSFSVKHDDKQAAVVRRLDELYHEIQSYQAPKLPDEPDEQSVKSSSGVFDVPSSSKPTAAASSSGGMFKRFFGGANTNSSSSQSRSPAASIKPVSINNISVPNGLYVHGTTGTGKTMLMDLFYDSITSHRKQRVHFAKFMLDVHDQIHRHTQKLKNSGLSPHEMRIYDPIPALSLSIAKQSTILCFDEFQVTDIVDAVLLNRLFSALFYYGIVCVATSNREPDLLYLNGLQRQQVFVPFLHLFKQKMDVIDLNSIDYRDHGSNLKNTYFAPVDNAENHALFEQAWQRIVESDGAKYQEQARTIEVMAGRQLLCPRCVGTSKATRFRFDELCARNLGSADYLALSKSFSTVFIEEVPYFGFENRNEMKRFILLIDELYNSKNRLVCLAADRPEKLLNIEMSKEEKEKNKNVFEDMFQFDRCSSRLMEMQSLEYLDDFKTYWRDSESEYVD